MRYRIREGADAERTVLVFSMPERPLIIVFLALVSAVCLLTGLAFAVSNAAADDALRALAFTGLGLFCLSAIFLFTSGFVPPRMLIFDSGAARLAVCDRRGHVDCAVPYAGISGFSTYPSVSERILRHSVGIDFTHGGRWELYSSRNEGRARDFQEELSRRVRLSRASASAPVPEPAGERVQGLERETDGVQRLSWRRKTRPAQLVVSLIVLLSFAAAVVGSRPLASGAGGWIVALAFAAFFVAAAVVGILRTLGEVTSVTISRTSLEVRRGSPLTRPFSFSLPLSRIAVVDFSQSLSRAATRITFLRADEVEKFTSWRQGTFPPSSAFDMLRFLRSIPHVDVSALAPAERLAVAEWIREALQRPVGA